MVKRILFACLAAGVLSSFAVVRGRAAGTPACEPGNGGITLPDGFCAAVVADGVTSARHLVVAPNGDLFVALQGQRTGGGGVMALRDGDGDGKFETRETFGEGSVTGIALHNGYLYTATPTSVIRYKLPDGALKPAGQPESIVDGLPAQRQHQDKGIAFDDKGHLYVNVGAPSNACQVRDRTEHSPGQDPCPILEKHGGIWQFDDNKPGQKQDDGKRYATGMRQMIGLRWNGDALYVVMHNRDQLNTLWPEHFTAEQNAELPSEMLMRVDEGSNFGWPYCFWDFKQEKYVDNPEYGGDGRKDDRCRSFTKPVAWFPGHWAPNDLLFYTGTAFPKKYQGGAFIAFHGSWNRAPLPQAGYNVTFVPFENGKRSGNFEVFANGFAGPGPLIGQNSAVYRPEGLAIGPDGSMFVSDGNKGRIWRVMYTR